MKKVIALFLVLCLCGALYAAGGGTIAFTSWVERRNQEPHIKPVWEFVITGTWEATDDSDVSLVIPVNGIILAIILEVPTSKTSAKFEVEIGDSSEYVIFDSGDQTAGDTCTFNVNEPVAGSIKVWIGPSAAPGLGGAETVVIIRGI